jgi:hypothetical protein
MFSLWFNDLVHLLKNERVNITDDTALIMLFCESATLKQLLLWVGREKF